MPESHRFIVDRHEGDLAVVEVDGAATLDFPRWLLPHAGRPDDVLLVSVEQGTDRTVGTIVRDVPCSTLTSRDRKSTRLNSSHSQISYAVFCLKKNRPSRPCRHWR